MNWFLKLLCQVGFVLFTISHAQAAPATHGAGDWMCPCPGGSKPMGGASSCEEVCYGSRKSSSPSYDNSAAIREQERQEAERRAEEQRKRDAELEQQRRIEANKRRLEEIERDKKFLEDRDAAAGTLRGSTGIRSTSNTSGEPVLRGSTGTGAGSRGSGGSELRGSSADTGLRGLRSGAAQAPNLDPMVVDARNVPSGLPKFVDDNIPKTPAGNRIRKGFQALMDRDWPVALAWFKDALKYEPGDAGIKRLIDLGEYTIQKRNQPRPAASKRRPTADDKAKIDATMAALERIEDDWMAKEISEALLDYSRNGARKKPAANQVQVPVDSDLEFLLSPDAAPGKPAVSTKATRGKQPHN